VPLTDIVVEHGMSGNGTAVELTAIVGKQIFAEPHMFKDQVVKPENTLICSFLFS